VNTTLAVEARGLSRVYGSGPETVHALRDADLSIAAGEFVAVMGPSGSGKSTLLHVLGGLEPATHGEIWLRGKRVDGLSASAWAVLRRKHVGFVFQFFNLLSTMTVADNVELPALLAGASPRQARKRREELLAELGITAKADTAPARLSGGEQQRVALARALAPRPALLFADEPTGNLDAANAARIAELMFDLVADTGAAMVLVTHDEALAGRADRVVRLRDGRTVETA